jgi:hypothetical protein
MEENVLHKFINFFHINISISVCTCTVYLFLSFTQLCYWLSTVLWKRLLLFSTGVPVTFCYNSSLHYRLTSICLPVIWRTPYMSVSIVCQHSVASWISWGMWRLIADHSGRAILDVGVRPLACWDFGFEFHRGHWRLSVVGVVCCQVEVSTTSWSLVQMSPTDYGASLCVIIKPRE